MSLIVTSGTPWWDLREVLQEAFRERSFALEEIVVGRRWVPVMKQGVEGSNCGAVDCLLAKTVPLLFCGSVVRGE